MTASANPPEARGDTGFLAPRPESQPVDHCFRCGVETPPGVGLCDEHNRGHLSGPSATQMHATIFVGIVLGVIGFFLIASMVVTSSGPFGVEITSAAGGPEGGVTLSFVVANEGDEDGVADCRVTRDGVPRPDDFAFRTESIAVGGSTTIERTLEAPPEGSVGYDPASVTVACT